MIEEFTGQILARIILLVTLIAPPLTLAASLALLGRYRKAVLRAMSGAAPGVPAPALVPVVTPAPAGAPADAARLCQRTRREPWRGAALYALAGLAFAAIVTLGFVSASGLRFHLLDFLVGLWIFAWPVVLTVDFVVSAGSRLRAAMVLVYFAALAGLGLLAMGAPDAAAIELGAFSLSARSTVTPGRIAFLWSVLNLPPTVLLLAFFNRRVRAVGPLVLSFMTAATTGLILAVVGMLSRSGADRIVALAVALRVSIYWFLLGIPLLAFAVCGGLGWLLAAWIRRGYRHKRISDQSLTLDAIWLLFAASDSILLALGGFFHALTGLIAFLAYKLVARLGSRLLPAPGDGTTLLFLRVFLLGKRSERLFDAVTRPWRHAGSVQFITGLDLAATTVEPHQFLDFVTGKLAQLFVSGPESLERRMRLLDSRPDRDGRFRINQFFCHSDTWQAVVARLVRGSDVVLMDLRSFSPRNAGCVRELRELVDVAPLDRLVLVVDETTDRDFLDATLAAAWSAMAPGSPNRGLSRGALQLFQLPALGATERRKLLDRLCLAATSPPSLPVPTAR